MPVGIMIETIKRDSLEGKDLDRDGEAGHLAAGHSRTTSINYAHRGRLRGRVGKAQSGTQQKETRQLSILNMIRKDKTIGNQRAIAP